MQWGCRGKALEYEAEWVSFAGALLQPWAGTACPDAHRESISTVLVAYAGDPRTTKSQTRWNAVRRATPHAFQILMSWLTRASIGQFMDFVGRTALDHQWKYRRAFWCSYLEAGYISDAWVVFGANPARLAKKSLDSSGLEVSFGELQSGGGRSKDHSALIMHIGDLIIVEWSHNGKYFAWKRGDKSAPSLQEPNGYRASYAPHILNSGPINGSHVNPEGFSWQTRLAEIIRRETGIRPNTARWNPKSWK